MTGVILSDDASSVDVRHVSRHEIRHVRRRHDDVSDVTAARPISHGE